MLYEVGDRNLRTGLCSVYRLVLTLNIKSPLRTCRSQAGAMAQGFRVLAALPENRRSVPSTLVS